jgi:molybdate transport system ATP-binding protein
VITINIMRRLAGADGPFDLKVVTSIKKGELVSMYGPTGSGKSSVLRMIAGLMKPDDGVISIGNETWFNAESRTNLPTQYRNIGMVFQEYSLFPNMTVRENLRYALPKGQSIKIIDVLLDIAGLTGLQDKKPALLSGGQKQRVALTRALVRKPKLLLLDEPLSALDTEMRERLQEHILRFHDEFGLTTILVSHDYPEILKMSSRVLVLEGGLIRKDCPPAELLQRT